MDSSGTPTDPHELRTEIEQTRAGLGDTVEALTAKADVKARAKQATGDVVDQAKQKLTAAKNQTVQAAGTVKDTLTSTARSVSSGDLSTTVRRPVPLAALGGIAVLLIGLVVYLLRRRRS